MIHGDVVITILECLERFRSREELSLEEKRTLQNQVRKFFGERVYSDGEPMSNAIDDVANDLLLWARNTPTQLTPEEVSRQLTNRSQKIIDRANAIKRKEKILTDAPMMEMNIWKRNTTADNYATQELFLQKMEEEQKKNIQKFWGIWDEIQKRTEEEWLFMKRLPVDDWLWHFLLQIGMKSFAIFFHKYQGVNFPIPDDAKIQRVMKKPKLTSKDFEQGQLKHWFNIHK